jgi:hypothetical protein
MARLQQALSIGTRPDSATLYSSGRVSIHAAFDVQITAAGNVTVEAAFYTPSAGNVW